MPDWIVKLLEQWSVVTAAPIPFAIVTVIIAAVIWFAMAWAYGSINSRQSAEIKLLERQRLDLEHQLSDLQKRQTSAVPGDLADTAELRLIIHGDDRTPSRLSAVNIWRWFWLKHIVATRDPDGTERRLHITPILYINFDQPVKVGTLEVEASGFNLPLHEVKEFTNRFAIIFFSENLPAGTLNIRTHL